MGAGKHVDKKIDNLKFAVITVSDTRTEADDVSGKLIIAALEGDGHRALDYRIVRDDPRAIRQSFLDMLAVPEIDVMVYTGGTGIAPRDGTPDVIAPMLERELPGFGELFRRLSYDEIGTASIISRAIAGTRGGKLVFCLPGSKGAVRLAMEQIILKEAAHMVWELRR